MLVNLSNIVAGFVLAAPKIKQIVSKGHVEQAEQKLAKFRGTMGIIALILGVIALLGNFSYSLMFFPLAGAGLLQALVSIAIGLILSANLFAKSPQIAGFIVKLEKYAEWIGIVGIVIGILGLI
jgi:hypothetical protein